MNNITKNVVAIIAIAIIIGFGFIIFQKLTTKENPANSGFITENKETGKILEQQDLPEKNSNDQTSIFLSKDKKDIVMNNNEILLSIDHNAIFSWFKTESQLCDGYNLTSTPDRKMFCENKAVFREKTKFVSIVISPDKMEIGFTIESEALSPDTVVGVFSRSTNKVSLLTGYYLGNKFISFSPGGANFIYRGECWEAMCGLFVKDSKTLIEKISINNPEYADYRQWVATFIQWISDNEVEYRLNSVNSDDVKIERKSF